MFLLIVERPVIPQVKEVLERTTSHAAGRPSQPQGSHTPPSASHGNDPSGEAYGLEHKVANN